MFWNPGQRQQSASGWFSPFVVCWFGDLAFGLIFFGTLKKCPETDIVSALGHWLNRGMIRHSHRPIWATVTLELRLGTVWKVWNAKLTLKWTFKGKTTNFIWLYIQNFTKASCHWILALSFSEKTYQFLPYVFLKIGFWWTKIGLESKNRTNDFVEMNWWQHWDLVWKTTNWSQKIIPW